jgi:hypothetical protein
MLKSLGPVIVLIGVHEFLVADFAGYRWFASGNMSA